MYIDNHYTRFNQLPQILGLLDLISDARHILPPEPSLLEIGVWNGESSVLFASLTHDLYAVDSFERYATASATEIPDITEATIRMFEVVYRNYRTLVPQATLYHMTSDAFFAKYTKSYFDMIYIDGEHTMRAVEADITNALALNPIILAGHDYSLPGVQAALKKTLKGQKIKTYRDDSWMVV